MTKFSLLATALLCAGTTAHAASFAPNNIVIYRVGDGVAAPANTGAAVFLDEYSIGVGGASLVQSIPMPTTVSGAQRQCVASGTATSEGYLSRSIDKRFLVTTCYARDLPGTGTISGTTALTVPRVAARIGVNGVPDTSTALTDAADSNNIRSAASVDGSAFWLVGGAGGMRYATFGATTSTQVSSTVSNLRTAAIFDGQLFASASSGTFPRILSIGTGLPTTTGQVAVGLPGIPITGSPYNFVQLDMDAGVAGVDTMYIADDSTVILGGGIQKWSLVGGTWVLNGTIQTAITLPSTPTPITSARGLVARANSGSSATLSLIANGNTLISGVDSAGYNLAPVAALVVLQTAATNTFFRGIAPTPEDNTAPTIMPTAAGLMRQQGSAASANLIATVNDAEQAPGVLTVTALSVPVGLTLNNINNILGAVTADVAASCSATLGANTVGLSVSDGSLSTAGNLTVNVSANTAPTLGAYTAVSVNTGASTTATPNAAPSDNGVISNLSVAAAPASFTGTVSVAPGTGVVTISNAGPAGSYTITVTATDSCKSSTTANFALTVNNTNSAPTITASTGLSRVQGSNAAISNIATVADDAGAALLSVTVNGAASATVNGVSISGIVNNAGMVNANIAASCTATNASFTLRATDGPGLNAESTLNIAVTANTLPVLSYVSQNAVFGQNLMVNPAAGPNDNGMITSIMVQSAGTYTGGNTVANTGVVSLTGVQPVGSHALTIRATDNCSASTDANLALTVAKAASASTIVSDTPDPSIVGQPVLVVFSVAAVAPGAGTPTGNVTVTDGVDSCTASVAVGQCSLTLNTAGNRSLSASYAGSADFLASVGTAPHIVETPLIFRNGFEDPVPLP